MKQSPEFKNAYFQAIMPTVMSVGREPYSCRSVFHPGKTCNAYIVDKIVRATLNCVKITFFASLIPQLVRKRKKLFTKDYRKMLKTWFTIIIRFIRATLFLVVGTSMPFWLICNVPLNSLPFKFLPRGIQISLWYGYSSILGLIVDLPTKMPSYMGFFVSKALSLGWGLMKTYKIIPNAIPFEKQIGMALLSGMIGLVSVKKARIRIEAKDKADKIKEEEREAAEAIEKLSGQ